MVQNEVQVEPVNDLPQHLCGTAVDNALTYADWRHPEFLKLCAKHKSGHPPAADHGYQPWALGVASGCFDLCHIGHVNLLQQAACHETPLGNIFLVVLLNSDDSVRRLKGPRRPIIPLPARLWQVVILHNVNAAAGFAEDTPAEALAAIRPDFLFKGAEYAGTDPAGAEHCGAVVFLPQTPGVKTSDIERRIVAAAGAAG